MNTDFMMILGIQIECLIVLFVVSNAVRINFYMET